MVGLGVVSEIGAWLRQRSLFIDPGWFRLTAGARTLATALAAVVVTLAVSLPLGLETSKAVVMSAMLTLFVAVTAAPPPHARGIARLRGVVSFVPAAIMIVAAAVLPSHPVWTLVSLALVAFLAVFSGRWGARAGGFGQLSFMVFYFSVLMGAEVARLPSLLVALGSAVVCAVAVAQIPTIAPRRRVLEFGVEGIAAWASRTLSSAAGVAAAAGPAAHRRHRVRGDAAATRTAGTRLAGRLGQIAPGRGVARALTSGEILRLRIRILDVEIAASALVASLPQPADVPLMAHEREILAHHVAAARQSLIDSRETPPLVAPTTATRDEPVGRLLGAIDDMVTAVRALRDVGDRDRAAVHTGDSTDDSFDATPNPDDRTLDRGVLAGLGALPAAPTGSRAVRRSVQSGLSTGLALILGSLVSPSHQMWAAMPAFQVLQNSAGETRAKSLQRIAASVVGAALGFGFAVAVSRETAVEVVLLCACVFAMGFTRGTSPVWFVVWQTSMFALLYDVTGHLNLEVTQLRVAETAIGAGVAAVIASVVLPLNTRRRLNRAFAAAVHSAGAVAALAMARRAGTAIPGASLGAALVDMDAALESAVDVAEPVRRDPGSMRRRGIEEQLSVLWAMVHAARELADREVTTAIPSEVWHDVARSTEKNIAGLIRCLDGRGSIEFVPAAEVVAPLAAATEAAGGPGAAAAHRADERATANLCRLNQDIFAFADSVGRRRRP